jgi:hypothetical protein
MESAMNSTDRMGTGHRITTGEKALIVMVLAGVFGYWAGFNLSAPPEGSSLPVVVAGALGVAAPGAAGNGAQRMVSGSRSARTPAEASQSASVVVRGGASAP